jgi:hypothetical protein
MDGRTRFGDAPATRARVVAKRLETLTAQLGLGASRQPVPNGRAMRVALRVAGVEPPWFNSTVCSHSSLLLGGLDAPSGLDERFWALSKHGVIM